MPTNTFQHNSTVMINLRLISEDIVVAFNNLREIMMSFFSEKLSLK